MKHGSAGDIYGFHEFNVSGDNERFMSREAELTGKLTGVGKIKDAENEPGKWNTYEIYMLKDNLTVYINGEKVNEAVNVDKETGKIGLQSEGGEIHFRTIKILPLDNNYHSNHSPSHPKEYSWPQFHGPGRDNKSAESGLLKSWPESGPEMLWTTDGLGHGFSSISVDSGMIFTAGNIDGKTVISKFNLQGELI